MKKIKKGFSLIELIITISILGIVASLASSLVTNLYQNYILQKTFLNLTTKVEIISEQISNRLVYRIKNTIIAKNHSNVNNPGYPNNIGDWIKLEELNNLSSNYTMLEWIGYDYDSFAANKELGWSGIANYEDVDLNISSNRAASFISPGSRLDKTVRIMNNLSNQKVNLSLLKPAGLIFFEENNEYKIGSDYNPSCMGLVDINNRDCIFSVYKGNSNNKLIFLNQTTEKIITERYKLSWSAYSIVSEENPTTNLIDLYLYYNYQPWNGESYTSINTEKKLLVRDVSVFKFTKSSGIINFKLCMQHNIGNETLSSCKEKVISR